MSSYFPFVLTISLVNYTSPGEYLKKKKKIGRRSRLGSVTFFLLKAVQWITREWETVKMAIPIPSRQLFINGEWREPALKKRIPIFNPSTEEIIGLSLSLPQFVHYKFTTLAYMPKYIGFFFLCFWVLSSEGNIIFEFLEIIFFNQEIYRRLLRRMWSLRWMPRGKPLLGTKAEIGPLLPGPFVPSICELSPPRYWIVSEIEITYFFYPLGLLCNSSK